VLSFEKLFSWTSSLVWLALLPVLICGCAIPYQVKVTQNGSPKYKVLDIQYQTHSSRESFKPTEAEQVKLVDFDPEQKKVQDPTEWTKSNLKIQYPHPEGKEGIALATLSMTQASFNSLYENLNEEFQEGLKRSGNNDTSNQISRSIQSAKGINSSTIKEEIWKWELPKEQLDLLILDLSKSGFFDEQSRPKGETHLSIQIDKGNLAKSWTQEPRLEDFIKRIYEKGWLDSFNTEASTKKRNTL